MISLIFFVNQESAYERRISDWISDVCSSDRHEGELAAIEDLPAAACSRDLCAAHIVRDGRTWTLLATRSRHYVDYGPLARACAAADIVVGDRTRDRTSVLEGKSVAVSVYLGGRRIIKNNNRHS